MRWEQLTEKSDWYNNFENIPTEYHDIIRSYVNNGRFVYRGMRDTGPLVIGNPKKRRESANTFSYPNTIIDQMLPAWQAYPDRLMSFICTTSVAKARKYGAIYHVIPLEGQPYGICQASDFWVSFAFTIESGGQSINSFAHMLADAYTLMKGIGDKYDSPWTLSPTALKQTFAFIDKQKKGEDTYKEYFSEEYHWLGTSMMNYPGKTFEWIAKLLDPHTSNFLLNPSVPADFNDNEVWVSGNVLFLKDTALLDIEGL